MTGLNSNRMMEFSTLLSISTDPPPTLTQNSNDPLMLPMTKRYLHKSGQRDIWNSNDKSPWITPPTQLPSPMITQGSFEGGSFIKFGGKNEGQSSSQSLNREEINGRGYRLRAPLVQEKDLQEIWDGPIIREDAPGEPQQNQFQNHQHLEKQSDEHQGRIRLLEDTVKQMQKDQIDLVDQLRTLREEFGMLEAFLKSAPDNHPLPSIQGQTSRNDLKMQYQPQEIRSTHAHYKDPYQDEDDSFDDDDDDEEGEVEAFQTNFKRQCLISSRTSSSSSSFPPSNVYQRSSSFFDQINPRPETSSDSDEKDFDFFEVDQNALQNQENTPRKSIFDE